MSRVSTLKKPTPTQEAFDALAGTPKKPGQEVPAKAVTIKPPNFMSATLTAIGTAPYLQNNFSSKNKETMIEKQKQGSSVGRTRKARAAKDFDAVYEGSMHISTEGWHGIPASAFRKAMIDACRLTEVDMTRAKMCVFIVADGLDRGSFEPLVKIDGKPEMHLARVTIGMNQTDIAARAMFKKWSARVTIRWDNDVFKAEDIANLFARAGWQVGIGAGRPLSKTSAGMGFGTWNVEGLTLPHEG
jgi:hypothetical protein